MSERVPNVTNKTKIVTDAVTLFVGSTIYEGWEDVQITRELNTGAADFQLQLTDKWRADQEPYKIQPGSAVKIAVGKQIILSGYVDKLAPSFSSNSRTITISGRSRSQDLVDCSVTGDNSFSGLNLQEIATKLCAPFGITPTFFSEPGDPFSQVTVQQGETVFTLLDKLARQRQFVIYPSFQGNVIFSLVNERRMATELRQGVNVLSGKGGFDVSNRFSQYTVKSQATDLSFLGDDPEPTTQPEGTATDDGVTRFRPLIIIGEQAQDGAGVENRASYEAHLRAAKSTEVEVEVQGWFQGPNRFWGLNESVFCDVGFLGIRRRLISRKIVYQKNTGGTTVNLTLMREDAFDFNKHKKKLKKEPDLGWLKVLDT